MCDRYTGQNPFVVGKNYFIQTVTLYFTGKLVDFTHLDLVLENAAWIAETGRFSSALKEGCFKEVEPIPDNMKPIINRESIICAVEWPFDLPRVEITNYGDN